MASYPSFFRQKRRTALKDSPPIERANEFMVGSSTWRTRERIYGRKFDLTETLHSNWHPLSRTIF